MAGNEVDVKIGRAVSQLRGDTTQQAVAAGMRDRGFRWSQATVWSVEKGERPLRLAEADALADVLEASGPGSFLREPTATSAWNAARTASRAFDELVRAGEAYLRSQQELALAVQKAVASGDLPPNSPLLVDGGGWLGKESTAEVALETARDRVMMDEGDGRG